MWITKHTHHQLPFQIVMFSAFCYLDVSKLQTQIGQLKLSGWNSNFNLHMYLTFSNNDYATHWYVNVKKNTRFEVQNDPSKKKRCPTATSLGQICFSKRSWQVKEARKSMFEWFSIKKIACSSWCIRLLHAKTFSVCQKISREINRIRIWKDFYLRSRQTLQDWAAQIQSIHWFCFEDTVQRQNSSF